ncbi:MAG: septum formation initiator family protein [Bacteroidales bacterium]|jgi:cell division protein FtsB|nr:septum formation initiator family protein [Bacteroidales bacterium]MDD4704096.1 septum formation initiator family protein [Bacteroidales bacterium]MDX9798625.1 septum formation initiator family protein [Bacteroidales bacterium]
MKFKLPSFINKKNIFKLIINRYFLISVGFALLLILGENSLVYYYKLQKQLRQMETKKEFYEKEMKQDSINIIKLKTDFDAIEKYGREKYMMKRDNEDIYIIR